MKNLFVFNLVMFLITSIFPASTGSVKKLIALMMQTADPRNVGIVTDALLAPLHL